MSKLRFLLLVLLAFSVSALLAENPHGKINKNISWELRDSVLYITGTGAMPSYTTTSRRSIPWSDRKLAGQIARVEIGEGITSVGDFTFGFVTDDVETQAELDKYRTVGDDLAGKDFKLRGISLPSTLKKIGRNAFARINIKAISFPEGLEEIGYAAFTNSDLHSVCLPSGLRKLGAEVFAGCNNLQCVDINGAAVKLGEGVFFDCNKLRMILHPSRIKSVAPSAFNATLFSQFSEEDLLSMFRSDGLESYISTYLEDSGSSVFDTPEILAARRQAAIDEFYVKEAKNATVMFNLDDVRLGAFDPNASTTILSAVNYGDILLSLSPEQYEILSTKWPTWREAMRPTFRPVNGHVELMYVTIPIGDEELIGSRL